MLTEKTTYRKVARATTTYSKIVKPTTTYSKGGISTVLFRITEASVERITEAGVRRITESYLT